MATTDKQKRLRNGLKSAKAKLKRRDDKIMFLEAEMAKMDVELKKKAQSKHTDQPRKSIEALFQDTNLQSSLSDLRSLSDAQRTAVQEILSQLLKP